MGFVYVPRLLLILEVNSRCSGPGWQCIDIIAPGSAIASARSGEEDDYISHVDDATEEYAVLDGTSQACPLVAGTLALYLQVLDDTEDAVAAMLNNAETVDSSYSDDPSTCASNDWLVRTPGTSKKSKQ